MNAEPKRKAVSMVQEANQQPRWALHEVPDQEKRVGERAYLWVRFRCGHYIKANQASVLMLLREAERGMNCIHCGNEP